MKIILLADTSRNELLVNFCVAYQQILAKHELVSPINTARLIEEVTSLKLARFSADAFSVYSQLASIALYNEIDALICLRDPGIPVPDSQHRMFQACDTNSIPYATNTATAEILILAISRGDLDWRELVRP